MTFIVDAFIQVAHAHLGGQAAHIPAQVSQVALSSQVTHISGGFGLDLRLRMRTWLARPLKCPRWRCPHRSPISQVCLVWILDCACASRWPGQAAHIPTQVSQVATS
jgi:hypothetical protein